MCSISEFKIVLSHPRLLLSYLMCAYKIADLTGHPIHVVKHVLREKELKDISKHVVRELGMYRKLILGPGNKPRKAQVLYAIVRLINPLIVVETGVQSGISSAFILKALEKNGRGVLYSIDYPDENLIKIIPATERHGLVSGWIVPVGLKQRWHLILGKSKEKLIPLLTSLNKIDIFFHDSEHSYENMMWEYGVAFRYLKSHGVLLSDDTDLNDAFSHFAREQGIKPIRLLGPLAGLRKA